MRTPRSLVSSALILGAGVAMLTGCSADPVANEASACTAFDAFSETIADAKGSLSADSTIGEITDARDQVQESAKQLAESLDTVAADRVAAVQDAVDEFTAAVENVDPELTIPEAVRSLQPQWGELEATQAQLDEALSCN
ncbi:hypothetical protein [Leucobacter chromiireducens]|uniref:hypothetical protein n=1 Tax=Leucobacter chromiireducens TaxID=283877 RepID=UPI003F819858